MCRRKSTQYIINQLLIKQASNIQELINWENILRAKNKNIIKNFEIPPAEFTLNPVEGTISGPTAA